MSYKSFLVFATIVSYLGMAQPSWAAQLQKPGVQKGIQATWLGEFASVAIAAKFMEMMPKGNYVVNILKTAKAPTLTGLRLAEKYGKEIPGVGKYIRVFAIAGTSAMLFACGSSGGGGPAAPPGGGGTPAPTGTATLTWTPNSEPDIAGYEALEGDAPLIYNNFVTINGGPNDASITTATFKSLVPGVHYFSVEAFDTAGNHSPRGANEISASIIAAP